MKFIELTIIRKGTTEITQPTIFQSIFGWITDPFIVKYSKGDTFIITDENGENQELDKSTVTSSVHYTIKPCILSTVDNRNISPVLHISTYNKTSVTPDRIVRKFGDDNYTVFNRHSHSGTNDRVTKIVNSVSIYNSGKSIPTIIPSIYNIVLESCGIDKLIIGCISECTNTGQYLIVYDNDAFGTEINNFIVWYFTECLKNLY